MRREIFELQVVETSASGKIRGPGATRDTILGTGSAPASAEPSLKGLHHRAGPQIFTYFLRGLSWEKQNC